MNFDECLLRDAVNKSHSPKVKRSKRSEIAQPEDEPKSAINLAPADEMLQDDMKLADVWIAEYVKSAGENKHLQRSLYDNEWARVLPNSDCEVYLSNEQVQLFLFERKTIALNRARQIYERIHALRKEKCRLNSNSPVHVVYRVCSQFGCNVKCDHRNEYCSSHRNGCVVLGCYGVVVKKGYCKDHVVAVECKIEGCTDTARNRKVCEEHGLKKRCRAAFCKNVALNKGTRCAHHGGRARCMLEDCSNFVAKFAENENSYCKAHFRQRYL